MYSAIFAGRDGALRSDIEAELGGHGFVVAAVSSGRDLIQRLGRVRPDVLVVSDDLGDIAGVDACRLLKRHVRLKRIPFVLLSSNSAFEAKAAAFEAGADDVLARPLDLLELRLRALRLAR